MNKIIDENFSTFTNDEIVFLKSYRKASKRMSFSFRWEFDGVKEETIFAYAALKSSNLNGEQGRGCRILDIHNSDCLADERFFNRIDCISEIWLNNKGEGFDYLWFYVKDIKEKDAIVMMEHIKGFEYNEQHKAYIKMTGNN